MGRFIPHITCYACTGGLGFKDRKIVLYVIFCTSGLNTGKSDSSGYISYDPAT